MYLWGEQSGDSGTCWSCPARLRGICSSLSPAALAALAATGRHRKLARGQALMWEGDTSTLVANVVAGVLKFTNAGAGGDEQIVGLAWPSDFLGHPFGASVPANVIAMTDSEVCLFDRGAFEAFLDAQPDLQRALLRRAFADLDQMRALMALVGRRSAGQRVAGLLLALISIEGAEADRISLPLSRQEMADLLGLTIETVSRQLGRLRDDGAITLPDRRSVIVTRRDRLTACARA